MSEVYLSAAVVPVSRSVRCREPAATAAVRTVAMPDPPVLEEGIKLRQANHPAEATTARSNRTSPLKERGRLGAWEVGAWPGTPCGLGSEDEFICGCIFVSLVSLGENRDR